MQHGTLWVAWRVAGVVRWNYTSWVSNVVRQDTPHAKINHPKETFSPLSGSEWQVCMNCSRSDNAPYSHYQNQNLSHLSDDTVHITGFCYSIYLTHCTVSCPTCLNLWLPTLPMVNFLHAAISHWCFRQIRLLPLHRLPKLSSFLVPRSV